MQKCGHTALQTYDNITQFLMNKITDVFPVLCLFEKHEVMEWAFLQFLGTVSKDPPQV